MSAKRIFSLSYLTYAPLRAPDAVTLAAELCSEAIGVRMLPASPGGPFDDLAGDAALLRETLKRMRETGVRVFDIEVVRIGETFDAGGYGAFLDTCAALGASAILVICDDRDEARRTANFAAFCAQADPFGLTCDIEFMPWTAVRSGREARRAAEASGAANARVLVDVLHAARSRTTIEDIRALPRGLISYAQVCDAPAEIPKDIEGLLHTARKARLLPGDGGIDIAGYFAAMPRDIPVSIELPNDERKAQHGVKEWARLSLEKSKAVLRV